MAEIDYASLPRVARVHYDAGYIVLSYIVSLLGSLSTLELLQLRTSGKKLYNWYLLFGSSVTMGGIGIWSMHFIGNRATVLYDGEIDLQLAYRSLSYTILSLFVPIVVLFGAYSLATGVGSASGNGDEMQRARVGLGGVFAGSSICGMHYLGDAGISNYSTKYNKVHVVCSVIIAVVATTVALTLFFLMRKNFTNSWWKRFLLGILLATAVSGMHWTAATGTRYVLKEEQEHQYHSFGRLWIVVMVIVLSVFCCVVLVGIAVAAGRGRRIRSRRAQRIVLVSATFEDGRLMVLSDGTLPMKTITDTFSEQSFQESFGKSHPVFHWIYRTSRNWRAVSDLIPGMRRHLRSCARNKNQNQSESYSLLFREMFCVAARELADSMHRPLDSMGVLHEEILVSGGHSFIKRMDPESARASGGKGQGKVLFLVNKLDKSGAARMGALGFRFTAPPNVHEILSRTMQVPKGEIVRAISRMIAFDPRREALLDAGVYLGCFALQPNASRDFNVLVRDSASGKLPLRNLGIPVLTSAHTRFLQQYHGKTMNEMITGLRNNLIQAADAAGLAKEFAFKLHEELTYLHLDIKDEVIDSAVLDIHPVSLPTSPEPSPTATVSTTSLTSNVAQVFMFKIVIPAHVSISTLTGVPLSFFSTQQRCYPGCPEHEVHARRVHREFSGRAPPAPEPVTRRLGKRISHHHNASRTPSVSSEKNLVGNDPFSSAGIMVSQTVSVDVIKPKDATELKDFGPSVAVSRIDDSSDNTTWCEMLYKNLISGTRTGKNDA